MTTQQQQTLTEIRAWATPFLTTALITLMGIMGNNAMTKLEEIRTAQVAAASSIRINDLRLTILEKTVVSLQVDNSNIRLFQERMEAIHNEQQKNHRE